MAISSIQKAQVILSALHQMGVNLTPTREVSVSGLVLRLYAKGKSDEFVALRVIKSPVVKRELLKLVKSDHLGDTNGDGRVSLAEKQALWTQLANNLATEIQKYAPTTLTQDKTIIDEGDGAITYTVTGTPGVTLNWSVDAGHAADVDHASGTVTLNGAGTATFAISALFDQITEGNEQFNVTLTTPAGDAVGGSVQTIQDVVVPQTPPVTLAPSQTSVTEGEGPVSFAVKGTPGETYTWSVDAGHAADVVAASGSVTLDASGNGVFTITAKSDLLGETSEQIIVTLTNSAGTVVVSSNLVSIIDNPLSPTDFITLKEVVVAATNGTPPVKAIYWGYNPHAHGEAGVDNNGDGNNGTNEGPQDGGIPVGELVEFLTTITGLDFLELGLIDADGQDPFQNVTNLTLSNPISPSSNPSNSGAAGAAGSIDQSSTLTIRFADGTFLNAEVALGDEYFLFLNNLLFDNEGNSRLFEKEIVPGTSGVAEHLTPIVLTPTSNNGGTVEVNVSTSVEDDLIVAGRLELLHQAYIDAGEGYNTLEVDAKGTYAQPLALRNIQEIRVNDLPNFYTEPYHAPGADGYLDNTLYNGPTYLIPDPDGTGSDNSWFDISRATEIEKLVVTDSGFGASSAGGLSEGDGYSGNLSIVGVRNGATLRLEGAFISGNTTIQYGQGQTGTLNVELELGDVSTDINILQNASVLNIDSQGIENHMHKFFAGGSVSRMIVNGDAVFGVDEDLNPSFNQGRPALIDASANTGGLDVTLNGHYKVTIKGTLADDEIISDGTPLFPLGPEQTWWQNPDITQGDVTIDAGNGNNAIQANGRNIVNITSGTGNDNIEALGGVDVTVTAGDGRNVIDTSFSQTVVITTGSGNDGITSTNGQTVTIEAGNGNNNIITDDSEAVTITTGTGNDTISSVRGDVVSIDAGDGVNKITVSANEINVTTGTGNDTLTLSGFNTLFDQGDEGTGIMAGDFNTLNTDNYPVNPHFVDNLAPGALVNLDLGEGSNTIVLGRDVPFGPTLQFGLTALEGSKITGSNIKLFVENNSDLTQADLTSATITSVVMKQELRITEDQFHQIGAAPFSVQFDEEGATEDLYIVVNHDTTLSDLVDLSQLASSVRLHFEIHNGANLTLTAEQLEKYVAWHGVNSADGLNGKVTITDAGQNFDPFNNNGDLFGDNFQVIAGGTLFPGFDSSEDVTIIRVLDGGYERPKPQVSTDTLVLNSNVDPIITTPVDSEVATLKIIGDADITFEHTVNLGRDGAAGNLNDGTKGDLPAPESDNFTIDFSSLNGNVIGLTIANFQDVKEVKGNGSETRNVRLDVELTNGSSVGSAGNANGLKSSGVQTYVVTAIGDDSVGEDSNASSATFYVCDLTHNVKWLGLNGNYNDAINFMQVNWGTNFLLEAGGDAKADGNPSYANIGFLHGEYFWDGAGPHASSIVNINNQGVTLDRPINVAGIDIDNADAITINVADGNAIISDLSGNSLNQLVVNSANDVTIDVGANLLDGIVGNSGSAVTSVLDATGVAGLFTLELNGNNDFSKATLSGIDALVLNAVNVELTLNADQVVTLASVIADNAVNTILNVTDLADQAVNLPAIDVDNIGTVSIADVNGTVTLNSATVLGNALNSADSLLIQAKLDDTTVKMSAAQFNQLAGNGTVTASLGQDSTTGDFFKAGLILTDVGVSTVLKLDDVSHVPATQVATTVQIAGISPVATDKFQITNGAATNDVVLEVSGVNDLSKVTVANLEAVGSVKFSGDATLTITAAQLAANPGLLADVNGDGIADAWSVAAGANVKLNIVGIADGFDANLSLIEKAGVDIGTLTLADSNGPIVLGPNANLADADSIVTPTKDLNDTVDGVEPTTLFLTAAQFNQLVGAGTITGDSKVNITGLMNNTDANGDIVINAADTVVIDTSGITAPKGIVTLGAPSVTLDAVSSLAGFEIDLANNQIIKFSTQAQASGATINETGILPTTAVAWLFTTVSGKVDTSKYDANINHLYILEDLVDGRNEEDLWTTLPGSITVEKVNINGIPDVLIGNDRVNTFEALTAIDGVSYDDQDQFETVQSLTINLEGNTNIGNIGIGDTVVAAGQGSIFQALTINSYEDRSTLDDPLTTQNEDNGFTFQPNKVGNISLNAGTADELINVELNTYTNADNVLNPGDPVVGTTTSDGGFYDAVNVNGAAAERDGLALEVGTINFAASTADHNEAFLTLAGTNGIKIAGVNISDVEVNLLDIDATNFAGATPNDKLLIGNIVPTGGDAASNALDSFGHIYVVDGFTAQVAPVMNVAGNNLLVVNGGDNDLSKATGVDIDQVHFTANGTLTLSALQVANIPTTDADGDGAADAWSALAALNVTLNIVDLETASPAFDLAKIEAAGINIGTITIKDNDGVQTIDPATTMGNADKIIVPAGTTLNLTALQFDQLAGTGTIEGLTATNQVQGKVNITNLHNTLDDNDPDTVADDYTILDVSNVTAVHGTITLDANDVSVGNIVANAHSVLGQFTVILNDNDEDPLHVVRIHDEVAGQTIRFTTAAQAERTILVNGADSDGVDNPAVPDLTQFGERDTNVIWLFDTITGTLNAGKIQTNGYDAELGRVWVNDALVNGQNVESIFSSPSAVQTDPTTGVVNLNSSTIIRVVNTADLANLVTNANVNRVVEVEAFTQLPGGLIFSNPDKLVSVQNLSITLGGDVDMGPLLLDNVLTTNPNLTNDDEFGTLTINSYSANAPGHDYLYPEGWVSGVNPASTGGNVIGTIGSGPTRGELSRVTINASDVNLSTGTLTFSDDGGLTPADLTDDDPTAVLTVTGTHNVSIASVNSADTDITAVNVVAVGYTGILTAPGTSPGFALDNTQTLTFNNADVAAGTITLGNAIHAGVAGDELSFIDASHFDGTLNLGVLAKLDSTDDDLNGDGDFADTVNGVHENRAFSFTSGQGVTTATLAASGTEGTPTLNAGSEWLFDYTGHLAGSYLKLTPSAVLQGGSTLRLINVPLQIEGAVNLSQLVDNPATTTEVEGLFVMGGSIEVLAGATLTLTAHQVDDLRIAGVNIVGPGTLKVIGDASNLILGANIQTVGVDISGVTLIASPAPGFDINNAVDLTGLTGADDDNDVLTATVAQTVVGSANNDLITTTGAQNDIVTGGAGNDTVNAGPGNNTINVDSGIDTILGLNTGDILVVSAGATANADLATGFVATDATVNNGTVNLTNNSDPNATSTIDVSLATGNNGFNLTGRTTNTAPSNDILIGSSKADVIDGGNTDQVAGTEDTLTGKGGADTFHFVVGTSIPLAMANTPVTTGIDREQIQVNVGPTGAGTLAINYTVNGVASASPLNVALAAGASVDAVAAAIAGAFNTLPGYTALSVGGGTGITVIQGPNGSSLTIDSTTYPADATYLDTVSNATDQAQVERVTIGALAADPTVPGETYEITLVLADGSISTTFSYTALIGDTATDVANNLNALITASVEFNSVVSVVAGQVGIDITDANPDNGGFTTTPDSTGGFNGSGASLSGAPGPTLAGAAADLITDFVPGVDKIDLDLVAGAVSNYAEAGEVADYATALTQADVALNGVVQYYLTSVPDNDATVAANDATGLLFFDANADGAVDGVIALTGVSAANFGFGDISA